MNKVTTFKHQQVRLKLTSLWPFAKKITFVTAKTVQEKKFLWSCEERHDICCGFSGRKDKQRRQREKKTETSDQAVQKKKRSKLTLALAQDEMNWWDMMKESRKSWRVQNKYRKLNMWSVKIEKRRKQRKKLF